MTLKDHWDIITAKLPSPQSYVDFGFYYLISLALQRRVWYYGDAHLPSRDSLFCNQYLCLVGPPAIGKGLILGLIAYFARYHKTTEYGMIKTSVDVELPPLFPIGADSITFEQLLINVSKSRRAIETGNTKVPDYGHCSYAFILAELSSLFKRKTEDVVKFLLNAYDCDQYEYETKHQGIERIRRLCMNFIAGTQIDFLKDAHKQNLFGQGFASRTVFLFENKRRFDAFRISDDELSAENTESQKAILDWLLKLSELYGQIIYSKETAGWLEDWYVKKHCPREAKAGARMQDYLGRKKVILLKLAAAMHFADSLAMEIPLDCFKRAIAMLDSIEPQMEAGLNLSGRNELHISARKMLLMLKEQKEVSRRSLILMFSADLSVVEILACIEELKLGYGVKEISRPDGFYYCL